VDDSRSMAENGCGAVALEAVTLIARSLARLEVGELGVLRFGGTAGAIHIFAEMQSPSPILSGHCARLPAPGGRPARRPALRQHRRCAPLPFLDKKR